MGENMRGFAVEVPYASRPGSGYSGAIRKVIADNPSSNSWEFDFGTNGYTGCMDLEIQKELKFVAWTHTCFNDITFFPQSAIEENQQNNKNNPPHPSVSTR